MGAYISATSAISPQHTFDAEDYLQNMHSSDKAFLSAIEPEYKDYLDPRLTRRMARIIKMSVASAKSCLKKASTEQPGAVIVGTGFGCLQDTEKFLADLIQGNEGLLSPTSFIQSTHNTIAGQIALTLGCPNHNFTFVQRGHSFETALEDTLLLLEEGNDHILVGGVDEIIDTSFKILSKIGCVSDQETNYPSLTRSNIRPSLGEGAAFFILSKEQSSSSIAYINDTQLYYKLPEEGIVEAVRRFLAKQNLSVDDIDAVMMGYTGSEPEDAVYNELKQRLFDDKLILSFKNLCGEYHTASAFGHHLAANVIYNQQVYPGIKVSGALNKPVKKVLFYNHYKGNYHTLTLMSQCQGL